MTEYIMELTEKVRARLIPRLTNFLKRISYDIKMQARQLKGGGIDPKVSIEFILEKLAVLCSE